MKKFLKLNASIGMVLLVAGFQSVNANILPISSSLLLVSAFSLLLLVFSALSSLFFLSLQRLLRDEKTVRRILLLISSALFLLSSETRIREKAESRR